MQRWMGVLMGVAFLAGCTNSSPNPGAGGPGDAEVATADSIELPTWAVGDWWTWVSPQQETPYTHVITSETTSDYFVDTDNPNIAFLNARFDVSSMGPIRKNDLAGSQGTERVEFFQFPLQAHKNWTTTWDAQPMTIQVMDIEDGTAMLHANRADGTLYAMYTFENETGHVGLINYYGADGTTLGFEAKVTATGRDYSGSLVRWELEVVLEEHGPIDFGAATTYQVPSTITDVYVSAVVNCTAGSLIVATGPPQGPVDNRGYSTTDPCPKQESDEYVAALAPAQDETWGYALSSTPGATTGTFDLTIWLRTLVEFQMDSVPPST